MDIQQLQEMGLVRPNPLVKKTIKVLYFPLLPKDQWNDPDVEQRQTEAVEGEVVVYLRKLTAADQIAVNAAMKNKVDPTYDVIHRSVYNENGKRVFATVEDAEGLDLMMFAGLVVEINNLNGRAVKKLMPKASSGVKLPSPSADELSKNGKTPSAPKNMDSGSSTEASSDP